MSGTPLAPLILNQGSGHHDKCTPAELQDALEQAGYSTQLHLTRSLDELDDLLLGVTGPVFVGGGDGSFREAALRLLGNDDAALALLPFGTSNNIAHTLGLDDDPLAVARAYAHAKPVPFDVGWVKGPWGEDHFFEAFGCGLFADILTAYDPDAPKSVLRGLQAMWQTLPHYEAQDVTLHLPTGAPSNSSLIMLEIMNIKATSNGMKLAPQAHPGDGQLDLVSVTGEQKGGLLAYMVALLAGQFTELPSVDVQQTTAGQLMSSGQSFHIDGEVRQSEQAGPVTFGVKPGALRVLLPI